MHENIGKLNCLRSWRIWNFMFLLILNAYLVYDSICQYIKFKKYSLDLGFGLYSAIHMNIYLICIILGLTCLPFSLCFLLVFNGNYADDNIRIGKDTDNFKIHQENDFKWQPGDIVKPYDKSRILWKRLKRHILPYSFMMHYLSAICFLAPLPFLEAHQIRQRVLNPNALWHTDLDFLFDPDSWHETFTNNQRWRFTWLVRPQYFNLIFCLICLILKYPSVYWACHKGFSFTFSFLIALASIHVLIDYCSTSVLIRLAANPDFVSEKLQITFISPINLMILSLSGSLIILVTFWCVFEFGFQQFLENLSRYRHLMVIQCDSSHDGSNLSDFACCKRKHFYLRGYLPHLGAICGCAIGFSIKTPIFYANFKIIYQNTGDPLMLLNMLVAVIFVSVWLITWFGFTLKQDWRFHLPSSSKAISDISSTTIANSMTTMMQQQKLNLRDQSRNDTQVYACYHSMNPRLVVDEHRLRSDDSYSEDNDITNNPGNTNYVYLQSTMNPAINHILISNNITQPHSGESPMMVSFNDNNESRNVVSESESSYDSASNIRNQMGISLDPHLGCFPLMNSRQIGGVLKYSDSTPRSYKSEYVSLEAEGLCSSISKFENSSSGETNTLLAAESDTTIKSHIESQKTNPSVSLNHQNSYRKRVYGQRVTFKDELLTDAIDSNLINSEQSSNNNSSSDSGIDSNSKQLRNLIPHINLSDLKNPNVVKRSGISTYDSTSKYIPSANHVATTTSNTFYGYSGDHVDSNLTKLNTISQNELVKVGSERHASYLSESDQEQRLCSQV